MPSASDPFDDSFENARRLRELAEQARQIRELGEQRQLRDILEQKRQLRDLAEQKRQLNDSVGQSVEIQKAIQRDREALAEASSFRYLKALEEDARRDREWMRTLEGALGSQHLKARDDAALRQEKLLESIDRASGRHYLSAVEENARRQQKLVHSIAKLSIPDFWKGDPFLEATKFQSFASLHPALEVLQGMRLHDDLLKTLQRDDALQRMSQAALFAVANAQGLGITGIDVATVSSGVAEALDTEGQRDSDESPIDLLMLAVKIAVAISSRASNVPPKIILKSVVLPLLFGFIPSAFFYALTTKDNERSLARVETALAQQVAPKRLIAVNDVPVRESGSKGAKLVAKLPAGTEVEELDRTEGEWRYVRTIDASPNVEGWAYYRNLRPK